MDQRLRERLQDVCSLVECRFPSAMCAFGGFARERMPPEDEDAVIEVFFAPAGSLREIARTTHDELRAIWKEFGVSLAVVAHYPDDTLRYYADDVLTLSCSRGLLAFLDLAGFSEGASGEARLSVETGSLSSSSRVLPVAASLPLSNPFVCEEGSIASCFDESAAEVCYA